jgi:acyl-CoA synthetase
MQVRLFENGVDVTASGRGQPGCLGPATGIGYLDDEAGNAALYTSDGWMLMADICTLDSDGYLSVVGRSSDLIIRGGKNISAAQVEAEVAAHPHVIVAAAVPMKDPVFGERVCVYVELRTGCALDLASLVEFLKGRGTSKEIMPERLYVLDRLPVSTGGKVAKGVLKEDALERARHHENA